MLKGHYFPSHQDNQMNGEGDVITARKMFFAKKSNNLNFLLKNRYEWMNDYINDKSRVVELGSGAGFSPEFIKKGKLELTDIVKHPWIDYVVDAVNPKGLGSKNSVDVIICSHMIHHLACPIEFFEKISYYLKPGGYILIQEINTGLLMRILLRVMKHEGWSYNVNVFDRSVICNDPEDEWSANCAIPELLFRNPKKFEENLTDYKILKNELNECFLFPISGGVIAKTKTIQLPTSVLKLIARFDYMLIKLMPSIFAMGRSVALRKA